MSISKFFKEAIVWQLGGGHQQQHTSMKVPSLAVDGNGNTLGIYGANGNLIGLKPGVIGPFGLTPAAARVSSIGTNVTTTAPPTQTSRIRFPITNYTFNPQFLFDDIVYNNGGSELYATSNIKIAASLEYPSSFITPLTFSGQFTITLTPGMQILSDPSAIDLPAGAVCYVRTTFIQTGGLNFPQNWVTQYGAGGEGGQLGDSVGGVIDSATNASPIVIGTVGGSHNANTGDTITIGACTGNTAANGTWVVTKIDSSHFSLNGSTGNGAYNVSSGTFIGTDLSLNGSCYMQGSGGTFVYGPSSVYGSIAPTALPLTAGIIGDSIAAGSGDSNGGWILRGLGATGAYNTCNLPVVNAALPGTTATEFVGNTVGGYNVYGYSARRRIRTLGCSYIFCNFGTNDLFGSGRTLAQLQADMLSIAISAQARGSRFIASTILPRTTSPVDFWATTTNQTKLAAEPLRVAYNTWLRGGAPIVSGSPVTVGTVGSIVAGSAGHPMWKTIDPAAFVEVNLSNVVTINGGYWPVNGTANWPTTDGTHPSTITGTLATNAVQYSNLVPF